MTAPTIDDAGVDPGGPAGTPTKPEDEAPLFTFEGDPTGDGFAEVDMPPTQEGPTS